MNKIASASTILSTSILKSGDAIGISARVVNNKPWFQVFLEYDVGAASSFYDGPDMDRAFQVYSDLLIAFKGVSQAEKFRKELGKHKKQIESLIDYNKKDKSYHNLLQMNPRFLGYAEF